MRSTPSAPGQSGNDALLVAQDLGFDYPQHALFAGLSFAIHPGLTLVHGGDGCGKSTLLRLMAGSLTPTTGGIERRAETLYFEHAADPAHDAVVARAWLALRQARFPRWQPALVPALAEAFGLAEHLDKPMYMLSAGSRRKVVLVAAAASGAALTLVDAPYAALDARSCRVVDDLLADAADLTDRAWVIADHEQPAGLGGVPLAGRIDLGDHRISNSS